MCYDISNSEILDPTHDDFDEWVVVWLNIQPERDCAPATQDGGTS